MDRIHYAGDSLITGTEIAHALLGYARALAEAGAADTVEIPTVNEQGEGVRTEVLVGPASQLVSEEVHVPFEEMTDAALVADLRERTENLVRFGTPNAAMDTVADSDPPVDGWSEFEDI